MADKVAVIDHGQIIAMDTSTELKEKTKTKTLEEAFLVLTGRGIREEEAEAREHLRMAHRVWGKGR